MVAIKLCSPFSSSDSWAWCEPNPAHTKTGPIKFHSALIYVHIWLITKQDTVWGYGSCGVAKRRGRWRRRETWHLEVCVQGLCRTARHCWQLTTELWPQSCFHLEEILWHFGKKNMLVYIPVMTSWSLPTACPATSLEEAAAPRE